ncbi:MAG TPA: glucose-6-phosphate isomerase [Bacilli bacterium]|nr:glucose-6-phosphate isomerase [Bacilli bacterium]
MINLNLNFLQKDINYQDYENKIKTINEAIINKTGRGNDYLGWATWPANYDQAEFAEIIKSAEYIQNNYDTLVVCGIGGSYLGARAAIEALNGLLPTNKVEVIFLGHTFSPNLTAQTLKYLENRNFAINVISKSGTTTETSIAFRLVKDLLIKKVGETKAKEAIFATTDTKTGALRELSLLNNYKTFTLPSDIGGRYSVLTAVGLLPIAVSGVNISDLMAGALLAYEESISNLNHPLYKYAITRDYLYRNGYHVELFVAYEPQFAMFNEWLKQLYGESEGKERKGLFPGSVTFSTDLHSLGQFIQDGSPVLFETVFYVNEPNDDIVIPHAEKDYDELNYLAGKNLAFVNEKAFIGTRDAHVLEGNVPNIIFEINKMDAKTLGYLFYFFMRSCAVSAYLLEINPFDQPGVEVYKRNMFALLGKK